MIADRNSWRTSPLPAQRQQFEVNWAFPLEVGQRMASGHVPESMDDRWFIILEEGWLLLYRSWTGHCIFGLKVDFLADEVLVREGWVSRDKKQFTSVDIENDIATARKLLLDYFVYGK